MVRRVKIFSGNHSPEDLEKRVNEWLSKNKDIHILQVTTDGYGESSARFVLTLVFLYEHAGKRKAQAERPEREHDRIDFLDIVEYTVEGNFYRDFVKNISESGVFIKTNQRFKEGQEITLTFMASNLERPLKIQGQIVRALPEGIGVKFVKASQIQGEMIRSFIDHLLEEGVQKVHYWRPFGVGQGAGDA